MKILNLHGINEFCYNYNYDIMKHNIDDAEITCIDVDLKKIKPEAFVFNCTLDTYDVVVGACFGGFYGYIVGKILNIPAILINPMIPPLNYVLDECPEYRFRNQLHEMWNTHKHTNRNIHLFLGDNDVTVHQSDILNNIKPISINHFDEGHTPVGQMFEIILCETLQNI